MKKRMIAMLTGLVLGTMMLTSCGSSVNAEVKDISFEEELYKAVQIAGELEDAGITVDIAAGVGIDDAEESAQQAGDKLSEIEAELINKLEQQLDPVAIAAEEMWTETLETGTEWKELIRGIHQTAAKKTEAKLVKVDLDENRVTYQITAPDIMNCLRSIMVDDAKQDVTKALEDMLKKDSFPVVVREITLPVLVEGDDLKVQLDVDMDTVMDAVTGGFYSIEEKMFGK